MSGEAPMPKTIMIGDIVILNEKKSAPYLNAYGRRLAEQKWKVIHIDRVHGRKRLYVDDTPSAIFASCAKLAYKPQSKTRREQLVKAGTKLP